MPSSVGTNSNSTSNAAAAAARPSRFSGVESATDRLAKANLQEGPNDSDDDEEPRDHAQTCHAQTFHAQTFHAQTSVS